MLLNSYTYKEKPVLDSIRRFSIRSKIAAILVLEVCTPFFFFGTYCIQTNMFASIILYNLSWVYTEFSKADIRVQKLSIHVPFGYASKKQ